MTDTGIATVNKLPIVQLRERLLERRPELRAALPSDVDPDHFIRALITSAQINPDLQACSFASLWLACMRACRDGLLPDGVQGAVVPFKTSATWIPMYQGLLKKFRQSGQCRWITAQVVRKGEEFTHHIDESGEKFRHVPGDDDTAPIERVYAAALTRDAAFYVVVLSIGEINKIKAMSKASREDAPWRVWPEEMMKKSALRRLSKLLPSGRDIIGDDDLPAITDAPATAPTPLIERARSAADALDRFASPSAAAGTSEAGDPHHSGEQDGGSGDVQSQDAAAASPDIEHAFQRGQNAKRDGLARKALPPEYRGEDRTREAIAWQSGWDGKAMPTWNDGAVEQ